MKRKYADYPDWDKLKSKKFVNKYISNKDFSGNICLISDIKVNEKIVITEGNKKITIMDDNFKWLKLYPENNKNIAISVSINDKDEIVEWYFDVAKCSGLSDNGIPYIDDLYLDVILYPTGKLKLIDEDELKDALLNKKINNNDFNLAYKVANNLINSIQGKENELSKLTYKYLNYLEK